VKLLRDEAAVVSLRRSASHETNDVFPVFFFFCFLLGGNMWSMVWCGWFTVMFLRLLFAGRPAFPRW
jgi:hypothetical protein